MSTLSHLTSAISRLTPLSLAETSWDNVGLMVEPPEPRTPLNNERSIYLCIDLTRAVVNEALSDPSTTSILTYHPPIFSGLKQLTLSNPLSKSLLECVAQGVSVFTIHTAADVATSGTNDFMASGLLDYAAAPGRGRAEAQELIQPGQGNGVEAIKETLNPPQGHKGCGMGRIVDLRLGQRGKGFDRTEVVKAVKQALGLKHFQAAWSSTGPSVINTIAICAGSGSSVLKGVEADLYLTGEMGHHDILAANAKGIHVFCCNHTATERPWLKHFAPRLQSHLNEIAATMTTTDSSEGRGGGGGQGVVYKVIVSKEDREPLEVV